MLPCSINDAGYTNVFLVDSGADRTVIPFEIAMKLNLFNCFTHKDFTMGVEGKRIITYFYKIQKLTIYHNNKSFFKFENIEIQIPLSDLKTPLLGRDLLFKKFRVTFVEKRKEIILEKN